jgi:hypothetical protein
VGGGVDGERNGGEREFVNAVHKKTQKTFMRDDVQC